MIRVKSKELDYHELELESSNDLVDHDSRRVLGRFAEAASHALQAGARRERMGRISLDTGRHADAAEDWLSAASCFLLATASGRAAEILKIVHGLIAQGNVPANRRDLHAALGECDKGLKQLKRKERRFLAEFGAEHELNRPDEDTLRFLQERLRDLPGFADLHYAIFRQALGLGRQDLAEEHLRWAVTFGPGNANRVAILGNLHINRGRPDLAVALGENFLETQAANAGQVRIMLANALGQGTDGSPPDQGRALEVLRPVVDVVAGHAPKQRVAALALSATFACELGREEQFGHMVEELNCLERTVEAVELRGVIAGLRKIFERSKSNGAAGPSRGKSRLLPERLKVFESAQELNVMPLLAA
ncbi:MAG TPA: hypothetical protein VMV69_18815 [Pirellulales bacterium]|nr:hypothetical protein [Pirellulales bacterium]